MVRLVIWDVIAPIMTSLQYQAIIWTNAGLLLTGHLGRGFSEIWKIQQFSYNWINLINCHLQNVGHFVSGYNVVTNCPVDPTVCNIWLTALHRWKLQVYHTPLQDIMRLLWSMILDDTLHWRHNGHDGVSNHQPHNCFLNRLFRRRSKKTSKLSITRLCAGNSPMTGEFPTQRASNAENVSIWWCHHLSNTCRKDWITQAT